MKIVSIISFLLMLFACNSSTSNHNSGDNQKPVSLIRDTVKKEPVAVYDFALPGDINKWHFTARLFETVNRFTYRLDIQYQEVTGSDEIEFPNFEMEPQPQMRKGKNDLECILGFLDREGNFREYILVSVENDQLRMRKLKSYMVTDVKENDNK